MAAPETPETPNPYERAHLPDALLESVPKSFRSALIQAELSENLARAIAEAYASVHGTPPDTSLAIGREMAKLMENDDNVSVLRARIPRKKVPR